MIIPVSSVINLGIGLVIVLKLEGEVMIGREVDMIGIEDMTEREEDMTEREEEVVVGMTEREGTIGIVDTKEEVMTVDLIEATNVVMIEEHRIEKTEEIATKIVTEVMIENERVIGTSVHAVVSEVVTDMTHIQRDLPRAVEIGLFLHVKNPYILPLLE